MLEWNIFVKPVMYVLELIFGAVVTFGTADKLLYFNRTTRTVQCAMSCSLGACISVIILGSLALIILGLIFWRRLIAAFDDDVRFSNSTEAQSCSFVSLIWLVVASVTTGSIRFGTPPAPCEEPPELKLTDVKIVTLAFAWLLFVLTSISAAVAWFVPDRDTHVTDGPLLASADLRPSDLQPFTQRTVSDSDIGGSDLSSEGRSSDRAAGAPLVRLNAARPRSMNQEENVPDTSRINERLSTWEAVLGGPPKDAHSAALAAAVRMPFPGTAVSNVTAASHPRAALPPRPDGLRRRIVRFPKMDDNDEIRPAT